MTDREIALRCLELAEAAAQRSGLSHFAVEDCAKSYFTFVTGKDPWGNSEAAE